MSRGVRFAQARHTAWLLGLEASGANRSGIPSTLVLPPNYIDGKNPGPQS
jgi:hypothetical protein